MAVVLMDREDVEGALVLFRRNLGIRPNHVRTHLNVARCLSRLGRLTEALALHAAHEYGVVHRDVTVTTSAVPDEGGVGAVIACRRTGKVDQCR